MAGDRPRGYEYLRQGSPLYSLEGGSRRTADGHSFLNPIFDAASPQPSYEGQLGETHTFNSHLTNQFLFAAASYRAIFTNTNGASLGSSDIPFTLIPEGYATGGPGGNGGDWDNAGSASDWIGAEDYPFPQGRNVTGYQFTDDVSWTKGR